MSQELRYQPKGTYQLYAEQLQALVDHIAEEKAVNPVYNLMDFEALRKSIRNLNDIADAIQDDRDEHRDSTGRY